MSLRIDRRYLLAAAPALGTLLLDPTSPLLADVGSASSSVRLPDDYPAQDKEAVREVVGASHFSLERVKAQVDERSELAKSAWDWGFGDWESALGAASHTGNRDIALYLMDNGARPNLFTAAMLGNLALVEAFVEARPGIQDQPGPHGIPLRRHAELGGEAATAVLEYLDSLGEATARTSAPLEIDREAYLGSYSFGTGAEDRFEVTIGSMDFLMIQRGTGTARGLTHLGGHVFYPSGAPSAQIRFHVEGGSILGLEIHNPGRVVAAPRDPG